MKRLSDTIAPALENLSGAAVDGQELGTISGGGGVGPARFPVGGGGNTGARSAVAAPGMAAAQSSAHTPTVTIFLI
jgi:hypothetical protein